MTQAQGNVDMGQLLADTLSTDQNAREEAVRRLESLSNENFGLYLTSLASELASSSNQSHIRNAAGLALKNSLTARDVVRRQEQQQRWLSLPEGVRQTVKNLDLETFKTEDIHAGVSAAQLLAAIAAIELPREMWPDLLSFLVGNVSPQSPAHIKIYSLQAIGFICESVDPNVLVAQSNAILTAVAQGARREEQDQRVQLAAINSLYDSLDFIQENFERDGERNYIMQVVCEATQSQEPKTRVAAYGCLVRIMQLYYDKMDFYMEKALFDLTIVGMSDNNDAVVLQAIEFWSTVCDEELELSLEIQEALEVNEAPTRQLYDFAKKALPKVSKVILDLLTRQDENADEDEWNVAMAASVCLQLLAQSCGNNIVGPTLAFVEANMQNQDWKYREAAIMAFGSILEGPDYGTLEHVVRQALPILLSSMKDPSIQVKDTTAWTLGRICELLTTVFSYEEQLTPLLETLISGLQDSPKVAANCCWAIMNLAEQLPSTSELGSSILSPHFLRIASSLLQLAEQSNNEYNSRSSAYECVAALTSNAPSDQLHVVVQILDVVLQRLEQSILTGNQIVGVEDRSAYEQLQSSFCNVITAAIRRLGTDIRPRSDQIMQTILQVIQSSAQGSTISEDCFITIGALSSSLDTEFGIYVDSVMPFIYTALDNHAEYQLCSLAVSLIGDFSRAVGSAISPYCDQFMGRLLNLLQSPVLNRNVKPVILSTFGDIAIAIGAGIQIYLQPVMQVLKEASSVVISPETATYDMIDYVNQLRESIIEAYVGIVQAIKETPQKQIILPYIQHMLGFCAVVQTDAHKTEALLRGILGLLGDLADTIPADQTIEMRQLFQAEWVEDALRESRLPHNSTNTKETGRWAREQIKNIMKSSQ